MKQHIILLRGVNVGGKNRLSMKELRTELEKAGFEKVQTYIQSGNIILAGSGDIETRVAAIINTHFGFKPAMQVLDETEFEQALSDNPYAEQEGKQVHFFFCKTPPRVNKEKLTRFASESERFEWTDNVFYLYAPEGIGRSKLVKNIDACLGTSSTARNLNTVKKIHHLLTSG
ncbi:MAG: DUF1697 domain-containing protein [Calditrichaeota bacterium]|nr:MAG: DUF1697 domain-containing protein [Calditrichota bacterium]